MMEHEKWGNKIWEEMKMHAFRNYNGPVSSRRKLVVN
jgi:hypothetical protein